VPTYEYACTECGHQLEAVQKFTDEALTQCPVCGGKLRKVFSTVGIVFKGSGFYRTDSRPSATVAAGSSSEGGSTPAAEGSTTTAKPDAASSDSSKAAATTPAVTPANGRSSGSSPESKPSKPKSGGSKPTAHS
jgi:putative FmdB family regulatory protein